MAGVNYSVKKAYRILDTFSVSNAPASIRQIAAKTGYPKSTVHELCRTLVETGQLEYIPSVGYQLGVRLVAMAGPVLERIGLAEASAPTLKRFEQLPSGAIYLSLFTYPWITYIAFTHTRSKLSVKRKMGLRMPLHTAGSGITILASMHDEAVSEYLVNQPTSVVARTMAQIELVRKSGFLLSRSFQKGISSVSAAILAQHAPIGALAFCEREGDLTTSKVERLGRLLQDEAQIISTSLQMSSTRQ